MAGRTDDEYLDGIRSGDEDVFASLFREHYAGLLRFAHSILRDGDSAEDVVQSVFAAIWARHASWSPSFPIAAYLFRAVRNKCIERFRYDNSSARFNDRYEGERSEADDIKAPDAILEVGDLEERLASAIQSLPERQRSAILLRWHYDLNPPAIAAVLGVTPVAVRKLLEKAELKLRGLVGG